MSTSFVRDRLGRASPRKSKKASGFPARKPGEPSVANVTRRIEFHLLYSWQVTERKAIGIRLGSVRASSSV